jgi:hypothetical protein
MSMVPAMDVLFLYLEDLTYSVTVFVMESQLAPMKPMAEWKVVTMAFDLVSKMVIERDSLLHALPLHMHNMLRLQLFQKMYDPHFPKHKKQRLIQN